MSAFGDSTSPQAPPNALKTKTILLAMDVHLVHSESSGDTAVIVFLLLVAILVLVGVSFLSSIDFYDGRRR
jgi:hypothetical protein